MKSKKGFLIILLCILAFLILLPLILAFALIYTVINLLMILIIGRPMKQKKFVIAKIKRQTPNEQNTYREADAELMDDDETPTEQQDTQN